MNIDCQTFEKCAGQAVTLRSHRVLAVQQTGNWFDRTLAKFRSAGIFQVPVGHEDEAGFHCGTQHLPEKDLAVEVRQNEPVHPDQF